MAEEFALRPRFNSHRELLTHLYGVCGIDLSFLKQLVFADNHQMIIEIVCFLLDRPNFPNHYESLEPGTRASELATVNYLGINQGYKKVGQQYNAPFFLFFYAKSPEIFDVFRILRSRTDWTSSSFRAATENSPYHEYKRHVIEDFPQVCPSRRHFWTSAYMFQLIFRDTPEDVNDWLCTYEGADPRDINPSFDTKSHARVIQTICFAILRNAIGGVNYNVFDLLFGEKHIQFNTTPPGVENPLLTDGQKDTPFPSFLCQAFLTFQSFALSYISIYSNEYAKAQHAKEIKNGSASVEQIQQYERLDKAHALLAEDNKKTFAVLLKHIGIDLCAPVEIIAIYVTAIVYKDKETQITMEKLAGINQENMLNYSHEIRQKYMREPTMLNGYPKTTNRQTHEEIVSELMTVLIRRNLVAAAEYIMKLEDKTLTQIAMDNNYISLLASTAISQTSTFKWLLKQKAKLCTNNSVSPKTNVFSSTMFSIGTPEDRFEFIELAYSFAKRNPAYKPSLPLDDFFEIVHTLRIAANWKEGAGIRLEILRFAIEFLVPQKEWQAIQNKPAKLIQKVLYALALDETSINDFSSFNPRELHFMHDSITHLVHLLLPPHLGPRLVEDDQFKRLMIYAYNTKNVSLLRYLVETMHPKIELSDFLSLSQMTSASFDYRDLFHIPSHIYDTDDPTSETSLVCREFNVIPMPMQLFGKMFGDMLDVDYCNPTVLKKHHGLYQEDEKGRPFMPDDVKQEVQGAAERAGVQVVSWDTWPDRNAEEDDEDEEHDGEYAVYSGGLNHDNDFSTVFEVQTPDDEDYLDSDEFNAGVDYIHELFAANARLLPQYRSPFLSMFQILFDSCAYGTTSTPAKEFGALWLEPTDMSIAVLSSNAILWRILRHLFPHRPLSALTFNQTLVGSAATSFANRHIWQEDLLTDIIIETAGVFDSTRLHQAFERYQTIITLQEDGIDESIAKATASPEEDVSQALLAAASASSTTTTVTTTKTTATTYPIERHAYADQLFQQRLLKTSSEAPLEVILPETSIAPHPADEPAPTDYSPWKPSEPAYSVLHPKPTPEQTKQMTFFSSTPCHALFNFTQFLLHARNADNQAGSLVYEVLASPQSKAMLLSVLTSIYTGYISVVGEAQMRSRRQYEEQAAAAYRQGKPLPPEETATAVPAHYKLDSIHLFASIFRLLQWLPQIYLKLFMVHLQVQSTTIYADLFDLFLSYGGKLLDHGPNITCRMFPAHYPVLLRETQLDKFSKFFSFIVEDVHHLDWNALQQQVEQSVEEYQVLVNEIDPLASTDNDLATAMLPGPSNKLPKTAAVHATPENQLVQTTEQSSSNYLLPVVLAVGTALAGLAGFFYYNSSSSSASPATSKPQQSNAAPSRGRRRS